MEKHNVHMIQADNNDLKNKLQKAKYRIIKGYEVLCPTDVSLKRMAKTTHDIFDDLEQELLT